MNEEQEKSYLDDLRLIDAAELGQLIGRATKTIKIDALRRPETLPPRFVIPGTKKVQWRVVDVRRWMEALARVEEARRVEAARFAREQGLKGAPERSSRRLRIRDKVVGRAATAALQAQQREEGQ